MTIRRTRCIVFFSLLGPLYLLGAPFVADWIAPVDNMQHFGEDEANRRLTLIALIGIPLFMLLWGWIGNAIARSWRKGFAMIAAVVLGTVIAFTAARIIGNMVEPPNVGLQVAFVIAWAMLCVLLAWFISRRMKANG